MNDRTTLSVHESGRTLDPTDIVLGGIWLGPGSGDCGDGNRPDLGQENATAAVEAALRNGIREFDTAPWYGAGASEERLGRALQALTKRGLAAADEARVVTKAGRLFREPDGTTPCLAGFDAAGRATLAERVCKNDYSAAGAEASLRESLQRLGKPSVFGLRVHDPNDNNLNKAGTESFVDEVAQAPAPGRLDSYGGDTPVWGGACMPLCLPLSACHCACRCPCAYRSAYPSACPRRSAWRVGRKARACARPSVGCAARARWRTWASG
tara:strand:+ start:419 stop:1222 length:804 start_codon:yes stop_codon:yes gene_type:complete|eukprot:scaffold50400_cov63-Phaeocystis_antarctica.AAC.2